MFTEKDVNKYWVFIYMGIQGSYGMVSSIDDFEINMTMYHNGSFIPTVISKTNSFLPWGLTKVYYNDVIRYIVSDERNRKIEDVLK